MRIGLGLGLLLASLLAAGCSDERSSSSNCKGDLAAPAPAAAADPPPAKSLDGDGPLEGDGQVNGTPMPSPTGSGCDDGSRADGAFASDSAGAEAPAAGPSAGSGSTTGGGGGGSGQVAAGTLTAGTWDDNKNFERFLSYRSDVVKAGPTGILPFDEAAHRAAHDSLAAPPGAKQKLDVSLVIDTTGSMGDEIAYLQKEFDALAAKIQGDFPGAEQRWSLVTYKDTTDEYVVRWYDFRNDTADFRSKLAAQSAGGGGDFPEAADQALDAATRLSWRSDPNVARLAFWVADAPNHDDTEQRMATAISRAQKTGIHVYPVASSGIDEHTELLMRSSAQLTGGRYLFLTDDSGVGGAHKEASLPCYFVTKLDKAILRMVDIEMTGVYREPDAADILRTGGDPESGVCTLEGGEQVTIY